MLSTASRGAPRARALHSRRASLVCATCQQRAFRFGPWSDSSAEADSVKSQSKRRKCGFRYRYMESVKSQSWDGEGKATEADPALVKATEILKEKMDSNPASPKGPQYINIEKNLNLDDAPGRRPGRNIEDVEREAINHLFESHSSHAKAQYDLWKKPLNNIRNMLHAEQAPKQATPGEVIDATTTTAEIDEGQIDPITNRRTPKPRATTEASTFTPKFEDVDHHPNLQSQTPKEKEDYEKVHWNEPNGLPRVTREEQSKQYDDLDKYKPQKWNEPDGLPKTTPEEQSKDYKDLHRYKASQFNEPNGLQKETPEELSKNYNDLASYGQVKWNEPDGLQKETPEELSKNYTDLGQYGAVRWNEPDGLQQPTPEELSKDYPDLSSYGQIKWNEPDGLRKLTPEEQSKAYDDLNAYEGPRTAKDSAIKDYEAILMDTTVKGNELPPKVEVAAEEPGKEYTDLGEYKAVYWNEPDGLRKPTPEELSKNYEDLHLYGQVRWNEPDGLPKLTPEEQTKLYKDLPGYAPKDFSNTENYTARRHPEEATKDYQDLGSYGAVRWNEPNGLPVPSPEEVSKKYADLSAYGPGSSGLESHSVRRHPEEASKDYEDLGNYGTPLIDNVDAPYRVHPEEASKEYADLSGYTSTYGSGTEHSLPGEVSKGYSDLDRHDPQNFDFPAPTEPFTSAEAPKNFSDLGSYTQRSQPQGISSSGASGQSSGNDGHDGENDSKLDDLTPDEIRANVLRRVRKQTPSMKQHRQELASKYRNEWDPVVEEAQEKLSKDYSRKMTGNYARDFPEEFSTSWSTTNSPSQSTLFPKDKAERIMQYQDEAREEVEPSSMDESFPSENSRLEPALNRHARRGSSAMFMKGSTQDAGSEARFEEAVQKAEKDLSAQHSTQSPPPPAAKASSLHEASSEAVFAEAVQEAEQKLAGQHSTQNSSSAVRESPIGEPVSTASFQEAVQEAEQKLTAQHSTQQSSPSPVAQDTATTSQASETRFREAVQEAEEKLEAQKSTSPKSAATYKILAYDPTTDLIRTAETTSSVHDTSSPLTPADVIPKLSNPAKFFVHFSGLQSQGYEMVSGERDVLVFRKVDSAPSSEAKFKTPSRVNPIDMMGKPPVTGNFASPTGFVNYDSVEEPNHKPEPPFRSGIDARREEPVYSGPKETNVGKEKKKRSLGKRMIIGTAYVAGGAYAVGVMGEYFATRGAPPRPGVEPISRRL